MKKIKKKIFFLNYKKGQEFKKKEMEKLRRRSIKII